MCYYLIMYSLVKEKTLHNSFWGMSHQFSRSKGNVEILLSQTEKRIKDTCITFFHYFSFMLTICCIYAFLFSILISCYLFPDLIQQTDWHRIAVFKPYLRETVYRYLTKGQRVLVQGRLGYLERRDPENNSIVMKSATIVADDVVFFNKGEGSSY